MTYAFQTDHHEAIIVISIAVAVLVIPALLGFMLWMFRN